MVLATSMLMTIARKKTVEDGENPRSNLAQILCIRYSINFRKKSVLAFFNSGSKVNAVHLTFAKELGFSIRLIDIGV